MLRKYSLEILLALSIVLLLGQLAWPSALRWWRLPAPGRTGFDHFDSSGSVAAGYAVHLPARYGADDIDWPLVVFLHGAGENGNEPTTLREFRGIGRDKELEAIVAAPQCLPRTGWEPDSVAAFVEHIAAKYRVDRSRTYLMGTSMGGYGTWRTAASHPELFAAIVPICGGGDPEQAASLANMPIWAFHGAKDDVVPLAQSERMIEAVRAVGGKPLFTVLPNAGHTIGESTYRRDELWKWLFEQRATSSHGDADQIRIPSVD
jgi:predicted peptidase